LGYVRLRDFRTHDLTFVWPKYLGLPEERVNKLERVIAELQRSGVPVRHMSVTNGFRTPQHNLNESNTSGFVR